MNQGVVIMLWLLVVVMVEKSEEVRVSGGVKEVVENVNEMGPFYGFVLASTSDEKALNHSSFFSPNLTTPFIDLAGRRFHIGKLKNDHNVIYVLSGTDSVSAAVTVQIMLDMFDIKGIVHYGSAGAVNTSMSVGDVSVFDFVAFTDLWKWKSMGSKGQLKFGDFNFPSKGKSFLGSVEFQPLKLYVSDGSAQEVFFIPGHIEWIDIASQLENLTLEKCISETHCLSKTPKVVIGLKASTANIHLNNAAYGEYLFNKFNVSTVDKQSAAVVSTAFSNNIPYIAFRGVSEIVGGEYDSRFSYLGSLNALTAAVEFLGLIYTPFLSSYR